MSSSPSQKKVYPVLLRSANDGKWHLKLDHDSDATKLSPGKGGELRDVVHSRPPYLGPDPHRPLVSDKHNSIVSWTASKHHMNSDHTTNSSSSTRKRETGSTANHAQEQHQRAASITEIRKEVSFESSGSVQHDTDLPSHSSMHSSKRIRTTRLGSRADSFISVATNSNDVDSPKFGRRVIPKSLANMDPAKRRGLLGVATTTTIPNVKGGAPSQQAGAAGTTAQAALAAASVVPFSSSICRTTRQDNNSNNNSNVKISAVSNNAYSGDDTLPDLQAKRSPPFKSRSDLEKDKPSPGIPIDAASTTKSISQFEDRLFRMELRSAEEMEDVSRTDTPLFAGLMAPRNDNSVGKLAHSQQNLQVEALMANPIAPDSDAPPQQQQRKLSRQMTFFANIAKARNAQNTSVFSDATKNNNNSSNFGDRNNSALSSPFAPAVESVHDNRFEQQQQQPPSVSSGISPFVSPSSMMKMMTKIEGSSGDHSSPQQRLAAAAAAATALLQTSPSNHAVLLSQLHDLNNTTKGGAPRPWETLDPAVRGRNPFFGILAGLPPHKLRPAFFQVEREFPTAKSKGLDSAAFARFLSLLTPSAVSRGDGSASSSSSSSSAAFPSESLVQQSMSYFELSFYIEHNQHQQQPLPSSSPIASPFSSSPDADPSPGFPRRAPPLPAPARSATGAATTSRSGGDHGTVVADVGITHDNKHISAPPVVKRTVPFPQIVIRYGADFSPRHTDCAVVAVFAAIAGLADSIQRLRPNSALLLSEVKSQPIREWVDKSMTSNSAQRQRWIAICNALDDPKVEEEMKSLVRDVVLIPPELNRSDMEKRIFGDTLPNGAPLPPPPVLTLDQWRYVVYGSEHLLPLVVALRNDVKHPDDDKHAIRQFEKVGG